VTESGEIAHAVVTGARPKQYEAIKDKDKTWRRGGTGWEITAERRVCSDCKPFMEAMQERVIDTALKGRKESNDGAIGR
jgi:hypothetical protein